MDLEFPVAVSFDNESTGRSALLCTLRYAAADPYAVHLHFPRPDRHSRSLIWSFSRQLCAEGLHSPSGLGDVRMGPAGNGRTCLTLHGSTGNAELFLPTARLRAFLGQAEVMVPTGTESSLVDWDRLAEQLSIRVQ